MWRIYRSLALCAVILFFLHAQAEEITREQAMLKAERYLTSFTTGARKLTPVMNRRKLAPRHTGVTTETEAYYAFNRGNQEGFVLVASDDRIEPVLGYTDNGEFDYAELPENMRSWLDSKEKAIRSLKANANAAPLKLAPVHPAIPEMLTTRWNQGAPYNDLCPMYNGARTVTGCVATAMAQVLYYQRSKSVEEIQSDIPAYTSWTNKIAVEGIKSGAPIDWANMLNSYGSSATGLQKQAISQLMLYCGVSVEMDYGPSSGAQSYKVADAMNKYFGYGGAAKYVYQSQYNETTWDALLYNELANGRVLYLSGSNATVGHAFVCDGYDGNHCFHINWGWGGTSNGFFLLTALNPSQQGIGGSEDGSGFTDYQEAIIGCEPTDYRTKAISFANSLVKTICVENWDTNNDGNLSYGEASEITSFGTAFQGKNIVSFNELYYFTGLTDINDEAFSGCSRLSSIKFPKKLTSIKDGAFKNCTALKALVLPSNLKEIGNNSFEGCRTLTISEFPDGLLRIGSMAFSGCQAFKDVILPSSVQEIGEGAFNGCTKLATFTVKNPAPQGMNVGSCLFADINLTAATLFIPQGSRSHFEQSETWNGFGTIKEMRDHTRGSFSELATNKDFYLYNVGTGRFLTKGEAWGTQAIVGQEPMRFQFRLVTGSNYYLYSKDTGKDNKIFYRTWDDKTVGKDIAACFVDGTLSNQAYWTVKDIGNNVYTLQIPSNQATYDEDQFLGINPSHESNMASPTYGAYSDVSYSELPYNCQWRLVAYDEAAEALFLESERLGAMLTTANKQKLYVDAEQAVYDNMNSTMEEIKAAQYMLRSKLGYVNFKDDVFRTYAIEHWDTDKNGEISYSEAVKVSNLGLMMAGAFVTLEDLQHFTGISVLDANSFQNCTKLERITLPESVVILNNRTFSGCSKLKEVRLPASIIAIGANSFYGCSSLTSIIVETSDPSNIILGANVFSSIASKATLYVPQGSKELYEKADQWKAFTSIKEVRGSVKPTFSPIATNTVGYIMHLATGRYLTKGEAYGTQSIAGTAKMEYQFFQNASKTEGIYYLFSNQSGSDNKVLFRTSSDAKLGEGVKACFVDGTAGSAAYWNIVEDEHTHTFTMQVPMTDNAYTEGEFFGVAPYHENNATSPTFGTYWDVTPNGNGNNIRWAFIKVSDWEMAASINNKAEELRKLLSKAATAGVETTAEQAVYDNMDSSEEELSRACSSLMEKLHLISFADERAYSICVSNWDTNLDGYLSYEEAAAVKDIHTAFKGKAFASLDELRYFTGLTTLSAEAFRGCSALVSIYLPTSLTSIENYVFTSCSALKYIAALAPNVIETASTSGIPRATLFVDKNLMDAYASDENWSKCTIKEYTGTPTVTADDASRIYGRSNPVISTKYQVTGAPINGVPSLTCDATVTTAAGEYPIVVAAGTITTPNVEYKNGVLTIEKSPLTITANSYTRKVGEENPAFEVTYKTFKNKETFEVLNKLPNIQCEATPQSPAGEYEIVPSGAEADNYEFTYVNGILTVVSPDGIISPKANTGSDDIYNLAGQRINQPVHGVNIIGKKKVLIK